MNPRNPEDIQAELLFNLGKCKGLLELLISLTPTSQARNWLTEANIHHEETINAYMRYEHEQRKAR